MTVNVMNPESTVLNQMDGMWMKLTAMILWKLKMEGITITAEDMERAQPFLAEKVLLTHGHYDSLEVKFVTQDEAKRLVAYDRSRVGHA